MVDGPLRNGCAAFLRSATVDDGLSGRRPIRHPLVSMVAGLTAGFVGAAVTIAAVEWLADGADPVAVAAVIGEPDFVRYCADRSLAYVEIGDGADRHHCAGTTDGSWAATPITPDDVCVEQYGTRARPADDSVWQCVGLP